MSEQHPQPPVRPEPEEPEPEQESAAATATEQTGAAGPDPESPSADAPQPEAAKTGAGSPAGGPPVPGPPPAPLLPGPPAPPPPPGFATPPGYAVNPWAAPLPVPPKPGTGKTVAIVLSAVVGFLLVVGGCAVLFLTSSDDQRQGPGRTPVAAPRPGDAPSGAPAEEPTHDDTVALDESVTYANGIRLTLSGFGRGVSSAYAVPSKTAYVKFTVKMTNGTNATLDGSAMTLVCQHGDEGREGEQIFDQDLDAAPGTHVRPGRSVSVVVGCAMPKDENYLQVEVSPTMDSDTAVFAGEIT